MVDVEATKMQTAICERKQSRRGDKQVHILGIKQGEGLIRPLCRRPTNPGLAVPGIRLRDRMVLNMGWTPPRYSA